MTDNFSGPVRIKLDVKLLIRTRPSLLRKLTMTTGLATVPLLALNLPATAAPATAAPAADPAPTNVTIGWADTAHTKIRVSWQETGSLPNVITSQSPLGGSEKHYTTAAEPNQLDVPATGLQTIAPGQAAVRIAVFAGTEAGGTTSPAGLSVAFDTLTGPSALIDSIVPAGTGKYTVRWHPATVTDSNPGDPLDLPAVLPQYEIQANANYFNNYEVVAPRTTATTATFTEQTKPSYRFGVLTYNEWGTQYSATQRVDYEKWVRAIIPAAADYGKTAPITGTIERWKQACDPGPCWNWPEAEDPRPVVLQARDTATAAWYTVGSTKTDAAGNFKISPTTLGTRQYRLVVPDFFNHEGFGFGLISNAVTTAARPGVSGKFLNPSVKYGAKTTAHVAIVPPANTASTLQRWDGTAWRSLKSVAITKGAGNYTFTATQHGRAAYRFLIPAFSYAGRPLTWQVSNNFVLTTT